MVISCRSKAVICAFVLLILLCVVLLVGATKGWFLLKKGGLDNDEHVAARTQVKSTPSFIKRKQPLYLENKKVDLFQHFFIAFCSPLYATFCGSRIFRRAKNISALLLVCLCLFSVRIKLMLMLERKKSRKSLIEVWKKCG